MKKCQEIKENLTGRENVDICFCVILANSAKVLYLEGRLGATVYLHPSLRFFHIFLFFKTLKCSETREATLIQCFLY